MINKKMDLQQFFYKKENVVIQHVAFWLVIAIVMIVFKEYPPDFNLVEVTCFIIQFIAMMAIPGYVNNTFVLPFFRRRKLVLGLTLYITQLFLLVLILPILSKGIAQVFRFLFDMKQSVPWENEDIAFNTFTFTVIASIINVAKGRILLEKQQSEAELRQLKEQLNPHFLFNTLNNLYGLSVIKSEKLPALMLKLSDLLRYSLYETNQGFVPLEKELLYIKNYIELEKLRLDDRTDVETNFSGAFAEYSIAPMMLIVFIENSFKHHSAQRNQRGLIKIDIKISEGIFEMHLANSANSLHTKEEKDLKVGGIGLANVKKRLDLIYKGSYQLKEDRTADCYTVNLKINLTP